MFVCTTQGKPWQELAKSNKKGVELRVGEEMQEILVDFVLRHTKP